MREIKFRAWDEKAKKMIYPTEIMSITSTGQVHIMNICDDNLIALFFTGLKDKNGKEIYEGDIVGEEGIVYLVEFEDGMFELAHGTPLIDWIYARERQGLEIEIIGNIHENPELLEGK